MLSVDLKKSFFKFLLVIFLYLALGSVQAATYTFPGNLPSTCSGSNGTYVCNGLSLAYLDTIVITSPKPATITINGNFSTNQNQINASGAASDLTFIVTGTLNLNWNSTLNANVIANKVNGGSSVVFGGTVVSTDDISLSSSTQLGGSLTSTSGKIEIPSNITVNGNLTAAKNITIGSSSQVLGAVTSSAGEVELGSSASVSGNVSGAKGITLISYSSVSGDASSSSGDVTLGTGALVGSITTGAGGEVSVGYIAAVCGDITTQSGDITLGVLSRTGGNVVSSSGDVTLQWLSYVRGSITTGGTIQNNGGSANVSNLTMPDACSAYVPGGNTPSGFNAFETSTAPNSTTGVIKTKIAGEPFTLSIVALKDTPAVVKTDFTGTVSVQLVNGSGTTACASRAAIGTAGSTTFETADLGRVNVTFSESNAWQDVLVRMTYTPSSGSAIVACSTDHFAIRPYVLAVAVTDSDWETAGTDRTLNETTATGSTTHKAGKPFTITATAYNKLGAITSNYAGAPTAIFVRSHLPYKEPCASCTLTSGTFSGSVGTVASSTGKYSEVGVFVMKLQDADFASIDANDGSTSAERTITSAETTVGRFVPDHYTLADGSVVEAACAAGGFTYMDQPFDRLVFSVEARNADSAITQNYADSLVKAVMLPVAENGNSGSDLQSRLGGFPATAWANGQYTVDSSEVFFRRRTQARDGTSEPDGAFDAMQLGIKLTDTDGVMLEARNMNAATTGDCSLAANCDSKRLGDISGAAQTTRIRFGRLRLSNAYGSDRLALPVPIFTQFYDGNFFATNTLDSCTALARNNVAMYGYSGGVTNANVTVAQNVAIGANFVSGRGNLRLSPPNPGVIRAGGVMLCVALGDAVSASCAAVAPAQMPWLRGRWTAGSTAFTDDPRGHVSFGVYKNSSQGNSTSIYMREMY